LGGWGFGWLFVLLFFGGVLVGGGCFGGVFGGGGWVFFFCVGFVGVVKTRKQNKKKKVANMKE